MTKGLKKGNNNSMNKTTALHKYMPDNPIVQFTPSKDTSRKSYSDQSWIQRAADHSQIERKFISAFSTYTAFVPNMITIVTMQLVHRLLQ